MGKNVNGEWSKVDENLAVNRKAVNSLVLISAYCSPFVFIFYYLLNNIHRNCALGISYIEKNSHKYFFSVHSEPIHHSRLTTHYPPLTNYVYATA
jgi:hypothetical protein